MPDRIALKRLAKSDLTFFEKQFRILNVGNQKSVNLNADVFVEKFYPWLPALVSTDGDVIPISLTILGPNASAPYEVVRAVTKREAYKNWRLNGEFVHDPEDQPGRFDELAAGDLAIFEFTGDPTPQKATLLLIAASSAGDAQLFASLNPLVPTSGRRTMIEISRAQIATAATGVPASHPVWVLAADPDYDAALEDVALGGSAGVEKLIKKAAKPISAATLATAKISAEKNGRDGEALAWVYLQKLVQAGKASDIVWESQTNAVSSFDFSATLEGLARKIDAKSTGGKFENPMHMSIAELNTAAQAEHYDLWRIYLLNPEGARLRIAEDIANVAKAIISGLGVPNGVTVDGVSIDPAILKWGDEILVERPDEDDT